jgi:molybdate transport system substrate-binding protein
MLAKQIAAGAAADVFLSADQANADYLAENHLVARRRTLLGNRLAVVVPAGSGASLKQLSDLANPEIKEIALALEKVPAGEYARQALRNAGVWEKVKGKVIGGEDVRATLAFVERGAAAGIVYYTDTMGSTGVRIAFEIPAAMHVPIEYALVMIRRDTTNAATQRLYDHLATPRAAELFQAAGFGVFDGRD